MSLFLLINVTHILLLIIAMPLYNIIVSILHSFKPVRVYPDFYNPDLLDLESGLNYDNNNFIICIPIPENEESKWCDDL